MGALKYVFRNIRCENLDANKVKVIAISSLETWVHLRLHDCTTKLSRYQWLHIFTTLAAELTDTPKLERLGTKRIIPIIIDEFFIFIRYCAVWKQTPDITCGNVHESWVHQFRRTHCSYKINAIVFRLNRDKPKKKNEKRKIEWQKVTVFLFSEKPAPVGHTWTLNNLIDL